MPSDLIVPAFALTLVANAILIGLAIRAFAGERSREGRAVEPAQPRVPEPVPDATAPATMPATTDGSPAAAAVPPGLGKAPARKRSTPVKGTSAGAAASSTTVAASNLKPAAKRRRRFALPPHEEDRERFDRSIATFLSGGRGGDRD